MAIGRPRTPIEQRIKEMPRRFWAKVTIGRPDQCWNWAASVTRTGYGKFEHLGRTLTAPRVAYQLTHGELAEGLCVCHRCDNPVCVNPAHLFLGTHKDNAEDKCAKGRAHTWNPKGAMNPKAKLSALQVQKIRTLHFIGCKSAKIAENFSVSQSLIQQISRGAIWAS